MSIEKAKAKRFKARGFRAGANLVSEIKDVDVKIVKVDETIVAVVSGLSMETIDANPQLKDTIRKLIRDLIAEYHRYALTPEEL